MEQLHNDLIKEGNIKSIFHNLVDTSVIWAEYCLRNNSGDALSKGLEISRALADYYYELYGEEKE